MLKNILILFLCILLIAGSIFHDAYLKNACGNLCAALQQVHSAIVNKQYAHANACLSRFQTLWESHLSRFTLLLPAEQTNEIQLQLVSLAAALSTQENTAALQNSASLQQLLQQLCTYNVFSVCNLL